MLCTEHVSYHLNDQFKIRVRSTYFVFGGIAQKRLQKRHRHFDVPRLSHHVNTFEPNGKTVLQSVDQRFQARCRYFAALAESKSRPVDDQNNALILDRFIVEQELQSQVNGLMNI